MKRRFSLTLFFSLFLFTGVQAQVYEGTYYVNSQADIDAFCGNYTSITGYLRIRDISIDNLDGFSCLTSVGGGISIRNISNPNFQVVNFPNLTETGFGFDVSFNDYIQTIECPKLTSVGANSTTTLLESHHNPKLISINCPSVIYANGLQFYDNPALSSITLTKLETVNNYFEIKDNLTLRFLDLSGLTYVGAGFLWLYSNPQLSKCCIYKLLNEGTVDGQISISNNAVGCNNASEITQDCSEPTENCWNRDELVADYNSKKGTNLAPYAHQYSCLAVESCEEKNNGGANNWACGFVDYSFKWMNSHNEGNTGSDVTCDPDTWTYGCFLKAGDHHFSQELEPMFIDYCKYINDVEDIEKWTQDHDAFLDNAVSVCIDELVSAGELESWQAVPTREVILFRIRLLRANVQELCLLELLGRSVGEFVQSLPDALSKEELFSNELAANNTLNINQDSFFISVGDSINLNVSSLNSNAVGSSRSSMITYSLNVSDSIATISNDGVLKIHNTSMPYRNGSTMIYVRATDGMNSAIGQYAIYDNDTDNDGFVDSYEENLGLDPFQQNDSDSDADGDGLTDFMEISLRTDPLRSDTDGDNATDYEEYLAGTDPIDAGITPFICQNLIESDSMIESNTSALFKASQEIILKAGFYAQQGSMFSASIADCDMANIMQSSSLTESGAILNDETKLPNKLSDTELLVYPNPSFGQALITLEVPKYQKITLKISDLSGRVVAEIHNSFLDKGYYEFNQSLEPSTYIISCLSEDNYIIKKLIVR